MSIIVFNIQWHDEFPPFYIIGGKLKNFNLAFYCGRISEVIFKKFYLKNGSGKAITKIWLDGLILPEIG